MAEQPLTVAGDTDERVREVRLLIKILSRPEFGALAGTILIFVFFGIVAGDSGMFSMKGVIIFLEVSAQLGITRLVTGRTQVSGLKPIIADNWLAPLFASDVFQPLYLWLASIDAIRTRLDGLPLVRGVPISIIWWIVLSMLATWILLRTKFGNWIFATGGDALAARSAGVPVERVKILLFIGTACAATLFAAIQVLDAGSADTQRGLLKEFEAIIAVVVGGTLLTGGYGSAIGAFLGALIFGTVQMGIFFTGVNTDWFKVFVGLMVLVAVLFNNFIRRRMTEVR
jgi:simple sugar transport system permease protein